MTENIKIGRFYRVLVDEVKDIWERYSFWTDAKDVFFTDNNGKNIESLDAAKTSFGKAMLKRKTQYNVGDIAYTNSAPSWAMLRCIESGVSADSEPAYKSVKLGDKVTDGKAKFVICDVRTADTLSEDNASEYKPASTQLLLNKFNEYQKTKQAIEWYVEHGYLPAMPDSNLKIGDFESTPWETVYYLAKNDQLKLFFKIGDTKTLTIPGIGTFVMQIADFNHDGQKGTVDLISKYVIPEMNNFKMFDNNSNKSWESSNVLKYLDYTVWPKIEEMSNDEFRWEWIVDRNYNGYDSRWTCGRTMRKLWIPTATEIYGPTAKIKKLEEIQWHSRYPLFVSAETNPAKKVANSNGDYTRWWTISMTTGTDEQGSSVNQFYVVDANGQLKAINQQSKAGFPLCFRFGSNEKEFEQNGPGVNHNTGGQGSDIPAEGASSDDSTLHYTDPTNYSWLISD